MESEFLGKGGMLRSRLSTSTDLKESQTNNVNHLLPASNDWKQRVKHKTTCTVFHKRGQSGVSKATSSKGPTLEELPLGELKERLNHRDRYLQELIEMIVSNE